MGSLFKPQRMCAQLDESLIAQFIGYWVCYGKPCTLTIVPSEKSPTLVGICATFRYEDVEAQECFNMAAAKTGARVWNLTEMKEKKNE